jgi:hypothetical protein
MNQWAFVAAAYLVTALGVGGLVLWSWTRMHAAEKRLDTALDR